MTNKQQEHYDYRRLNDLDIVGVARRLNVSLRRAGINYKTYCPWHPDKHPSLVLYNKPGNRHCHCYACGEHHSVIDFAMKAGGWTDVKDACEWLSREFGIGTVDKWRYIAAPKPIVAKQPKEPDYRYIPMEKVDEMVSTESTLCRCLMRMAHSTQARWTPEAVAWQVEEYRLGSYTLWGTEDYTAFPSIDYQGRVCNIKVQHYDTDPLSPRFAHDNIGQSYMLASIWLADGKLKFDDCPKRDDIRFRNDCLFGEHLLKQYPAATVALVESPKNALFGALDMPEMVWVAAGNKHNLKREVLRSLIGRDVVVFPDRDAIPLWTDTLRGMRDLANFTVSDFCERYAPKEQLKFDIADYLQAEIMGT